VGIRLECTRKSDPENNGAHERMHRTLKREATRPARRTPELQQRAFNQFRKIYKDERLHEALALETPGSLYTRAKRRMPRRMPPVIYPEGYHRRRVNQHG
jgi:putative transposase